MRNPLLTLVTVMICAIAWAQSQPNPAKTGDASMPDMPAHHDMSDMKDMSAEKEDSAAGAHAMHSMEGHIDMGPHMKMTTLRKPRPGDADRAQEIVDAARKASAKYTDYHAALADGFKIFLPNVPQKMYHFTNYGYGLEAAIHFNPEHPTSLLYEKHGDDYTLIGVMYTAPKRFDENQLDERIPLSVAQWHEHVNFCMAPAGRKKEMLQPHPQFGLRGLITTQEACDAAGGTFHPVVLNWMVHLYPFEKDPAKIWSVERQHAD
jgi:hypothetical protein